MGEPGRVKNQEKGPREKVAASSWPSRTVTWCTLKRVPPSQGKARAQGPRDPPPGARASNPRPEKEDLKEQGLLPQRRERGPQGAGLHSSQRAGLHSPLRPQGESQRVHVSPARPVQGPTREPVPDPRRGPGEGTTEGWPRRGAPPPPR